MAKNNAIGAPIPFSVTKGGIGSDGSGLTSNSVIVTNTVATGPFLSIGPGAAGEVLTSNGVGAAPSFEPAGGGFANTALSNLAAVSINESLISDTDITDNLGSQAIRWNNIYGATLQTGDTAADTLQIGAWDVDGAAFVPFMTMTANNTPTGTLSGSVTGVTQTGGDNSTKLATTAYVDAAIPVVGANTALSNLASVAINTTLVSDADVTDNLGTQAIRWNNVYSATVQTGDTAADTLQLGAWDVDGAAFVPFITFTANNTPTGVIASGMTATTQAASDNSTKLATTAYVDAAIPAAGANTALSNLASVAINTSLISDSDVTDNLGSQALRWNNVYAETVQTGDTAGDALQLGAWDVDGGVFIPYITFIANNTTTGVIASGMTATTQTALNNSTKLATTAYTDNAAGVVNTELNRRVNLAQTNVAANSNTTFTLVSNTADYYKVTFTSNCTIAFTFPAAEVTSMCVQLINAGAYTVAFTGLLWAGGVAPTFTAAGTDMIVVWQNGDNIKYASLIGKAFA